MASTAVTKPASSVPALAQTPALQFSAEDISPPRIKLGQFSSGAVQEDLVKPGVIFAQVNAEDPSPEIFDTPILVHIIGMKRGLSYSEGGNSQLQRFEYGDPDAPKGAWITFDYTVVLPDHDQSMPYKLMMTRSSVPCARGMNTAILRGGRPAYEYAFELSPKEGTSPNGKYWKWQAKIVEATKENIELAASLAVSLAPEAVESAGSSAPDQPEI